MADQLADSGHSAHLKSPISVPYLLAAAALIGVGLACASLWIVLFNWLLFLGFAPLALGAFMLFSPRAGADRADAPIAG
jgi:hypothetical protein